MTPLLANDEAYIAGDIRVHRYAGPPYDQVNSYWVETPTAIFIVDAQRYKHQAAYLIAAIRSVSGKPVAAILITHHHPDHTGGLSTLRQAFPEAAIYSSAFTQQDIRTDASGLLAARCKMFGEDFPNPQEFPVPDHAVNDGQRFQVAGVHIVARVLTNVDSPASVVWLLPGHRILFFGDFAVDRKTPSLRNGTSTSYLAALSRIEAETPEYDQAFPGHGNPQPPASLVQQTRAYIVEVRKQVQAALATGTPLAAGSVAAIKAALLTGAEFNYDTPLFPAEHEANIIATARELSRLPADIVREFIDIVRTGKAPDRAAEFMGPKVLAHQLTSEGETTVERSPADYAEHIRDFLRMYGAFRFTGRCPGFSCR